jgi:hypothetical protein
MTLRACATKTSGMTDTAAWTKHSNAYEAYFKEITSDDAHDPQWENALVPVTERLHVSNIALANLLFAPSEESNETPSITTSTSKPARKRKSGLSGSDVPPVPPLPGTAL